MDDQPVGTDHLQRALDGDGDSWNVIVDAYASLVWSVVRTYRMDLASQEDAYQATWLRLLDRGSTIRDPSRLSSWLVTTAKRECLGVLRSSNRVAPATDALDAMLPPSELESNLEQLEINGAVRVAFDQLDEKCRTLLSMVVADPPLAYETISESLDMPVGSIGPTRGRCLDKLRTIFTRIIEPEAPSADRETRT